MFSGVLQAQTSDNLDKPAANSLNSKGKELILGIPKLTDKTLYNLTGAIGQISGLKYDTYCPKHNLVLLTFDPTKFNRGEEVIQAIKDNDFNLQMFIKEGNFREVKQMCSEN